MKTTKTIAITTAATTTDMKKRTCKCTPAPTQRALSIVGGTSDTDVNGSYTGRPKNKRELPVQDADDL